MGRPKRNCRVGRFSITLSPTRYLHNGTLLLIGVEIVRFDEKLSYSVRDLIREVDIWHEGQPLPITGGCHNEPLITGFLQFLGGTPSESMRAIALSRWHPKSCQGVPNSPVNVIRVNLLGRNSPDRRFARTHGQNQWTGQDARALSVLRSRKQWRFIMQPPGMCFRHANLTMRTSWPLIERQVIRAFSRWGGWYRFHPLCEHVVPGAMRRAL